MQTKLLNLARAFTKTVLVGLLSPLKLIVPMGRVVLFGTFSKGMYRENTRYIFEYMSQHTNVPVYWVTDSKVVVEYLKAKNFRYLYTKNIWQKIFLLLRARVVVDTGTGYFNFLNLLHQKAIKICTNHGNGPKAIVNVFDDFQTTLKFMFAVNEFDYVNYPSEYSKLKLGGQQFKLPAQKRINLGYPRCDRYFDTAHVEETYRNKTLVKAMLPGFNPSAKIIFYTPTWRPYPYEFPLLKMIGIDLAAFNEFLEQHNLYFLYTLHTLNSPKEFPTGFSRIIALNPAQFPLFDTNNLMLEVDILLNDYSTTSTEFWLLKRPQIFFMPDFAKYDSEKGFAEDYRELLVGDEVGDYSQFVQTILTAVQDPANYVQKYLKQGDSLLQKYYDVSKTNSCQQFSNFIEQLV